MSDVTEVVTFGDLVTDFINRSRGSTAQTATQVLAKRYINQSLLDVHVLPGNKFPWQFRRASLITNPPYQTGTISIGDSTRVTVTGLGTAWNTAVPGFGVNNAQVGGKMAFGSINEVYDVLAVPSNTSITLATRYTGDALTNQGYSYFEDEYALVPDFKEFVDVRMFSTDMNIPLIGSLEFRRRFPRNNIPGRPRVACHIQLGFASTTAPRHRVVFNPAPDARYTIPYWYVTSNLAVTSAGVEQARLVNDTDEPIVPVGFRHVILFHALHNWFTYYGDDVRSAEAKAEYADLMTRISGMREVGNERPQLVIRHQYPSGSGIMPRFDVGGRFDRME